MTGLRYAPDIETRDEDEQTTIDGIIQVMTMQTNAVPPRSLQELIARKEQARRRFDDMPILEKMEMAVRMYRDQARVLRGMVGTAPRA